MLIYQQHDEQVSDGANLLISILVRYPEIATINFESERDLLNLTFIISGMLNAEQFADCKEMIAGSIDAYHLLENREYQVAEVQLDTYEQVSLLHIRRDVQSLSKGEIALLISLLRDRFKDKLTADHHESLQEEEMLLQEEIIDNMLETMKRRQILQNLIGIREDGRVLVFNK